MKVFVFAPHPDDETLGCGGTIFRHVAEGDEMHWVVVTGIDAAEGWPEDVVRKRDAEIKTVIAEYGFSGVPLGVPDHSS